MIVAETFLQLLRDPGHWMFEGLSDLVLAGVSALIARPLIRRHDRRHHGGS